MSATKDSSDKIARRLAAIPQEVLDGLRPALVRSGNEVADKARRLDETSRDSGDLIESITVTEPGQQTPAYAQGGGKRTAGPNQVLVTVGDENTRHGHLVEFGAGEEGRVIKTGPMAGVDVGVMPAKPFLLPAWRLSKKRIEGRIQRAIRAAIKKATK